MEFVEKSDESRAADAVGAVYTNTHHRTALIPGRRVAQPPRHSYVLFPQGGHCAIADDGSFICDRTGLRLQRLGAAKPPDPSTPPHPSAFAITGEPS